MLRKKRSPDYARAARIFLIMYLVTSLMALMRFAYVTFAS